MTTGRTRCGYGRVLSLVVLVLAAFLPSACGVPSDESPQIIAFDDLGGALGDPSTTLLSTPTPEPSTELLTGAAFVYFVDQINLLQPEQRDVVLLTNDQRALPILEALIAGPDEEERGILGLSTGLPNDIVVNSIDVNAAGLAIVDIAAGQIEELRGENLRIALAQIVFTLTELSGIESVRLRIDGEDRPLATGDGGVTELVEPVTRADYAVYAPADPGEAETTPTPDPDQLPATNPDGELLPTPDPDPDPTATPLPGTPLPLPDDEPTPEPTADPTAEPDDADDEAADA